MFELDFISLLNKYSNSSQDDKEDLFNKLVLLIKNNPIDYQKFLQNGNISENLKELLSNCEEKIKNENLDDKENEEVNVESNKEESYLTKIKNQILLIIIQLKKKSFKSSGLGYHPSSNYY